MKDLETKRLVIRPFASDDLPVIHRILDQTLGNGLHVDDKAALLERKSWLRWSILNATWLATLHQPPYGDRAVVLKTTGELIGSVGYVPLLDVYEQIPELNNGTSRENSYRTPEFGLFWAIDPSHQRQGYAGEAAAAMVTYAFEELRLKRILATTEYANEASQGVMRKLGMTLAQNPSPDPPWLQIVGFLEIV
ncbi:MAG: GNAT family N-acetyltransferase [Anaerolineae bacterium]|nr:GNAT family N-acetyltransferase [Anaerolineae bacterium]